MKKMNPVVHFEMPARDRQRMSDFYTKVFGWKCQQQDEKMGSYVVVSTTETDEKGHPKMPGAIGGGFFMRQEPIDAPSIVIAVDDIIESMKQVQAAGGKVLDKPVEIPGIGQYVSFVDTEGNKVSILQPKM